MWVHKFIHGIQPVSKSLYLHEETKIQMRIWDDVQTHLCDGFSFVRKYKEVTTIMNLIKSYLFTDTLWNLRNNIVYSYHQ